MAELFSLATKRNLSPVCWELGFFTLRDLVDARNPHFRQRAWSRPDTAWGCGVMVVCLGDHVCLVAHEPDTNSYQRLVAGA